MRNDDITKLVSSINTASVVVITPGNEDVKTDAEITDSIKNKMTPVKTTRQADKSADRPTVPIKRIVKKPAPVKTTRQATKPTDHPKVSPRPSVKKRAKKKPRK